MTFVEGDVFRADVHRVHRRPSRFRNDPRGQHAAAPASVGNVASDHVGEVEPSRVGEYDVEVVPLRPGRVPRRRTARKVQAVDGSVELGRRRSTPGAVGVHVGPGAGEQIGGRTKVRRSAGERGAGRNRHQPRVGFEVEELVVDPWGRRRDPVVETAAREHLTVEERGLLDGEVHRARAAGAERLQIDSLGQYDQVPAAQQFPVARLIDHGLSHREQDDRNPHAERVAAEQERAAPGSLPYRGPDEPQDHGKALPSTTSILRLAPAASSRSWVATTSVVPSSFSDWKQKPEQKKPGYS